MKFKVGDKVRYNREFLVDRLETGNGFRYTGIEGFNIIEISEKEVKSEDGFWFYKDQLELVLEEPEFEYGEEIEVSDNGKTWEKVIFLIKIPGNIEYPYLCVASSDKETFSQGKIISPCEWRYARKPKLELTRKEIANHFGVDENFVLIE